MWGFRPNQCISTYINLYYDSWYRHTQIVPAIYYLWPCSLAVPVLAGGVYSFVVLCPGAPECSTGSGSGFKASHKTRQLLKVSSERLGEAGKLNLIYDTPS